MINTLIIIILVLFALALTLIIVAYACGLAVAVGLDNGIKDSLKRNQRVKIKSIGFRKL